MAKYDQRLRKRRVDETKALASAFRGAITTQSPCIHVAHGGKVSGNYTQKAWTEGVVCVAWPDGRHWMSKIIRIPARRPTAGGIFRKISGGGCAFDDRRTAAARAESRAQFLKTISESLETQEVAV